MVTKIKNNKPEVKSEVKEEVKTVKSTGELRKQVQKARAELFALQLEHTQGKVKNTASLSVKRKEIARLLTTLRSTELSI